MQLEFIANCNVHCLIKDIFINIAWSKTNKSSFILKSKNETMVFKVNTCINTCIKTFSF